MKTYMLQTQTTTAGLPWEHKFEMSSDEMAIDFARRQTKQFVHVPWFIRMLLWDMTSEAEKVISTVVILEPGIRREDQWEIKS